MSCLALPHVIRTRCRALTCWAAAMCRCQLVKVYADVGKQDWPHAFPTFLDTIMSLFQQPESLELGLSMLQATTQELANAKGVPVSCPDAAAHG